MGFYHADYYERNKDRIKKQALNWYYLNKDKANSRRRIRKQLSKIYHDPSFCNYHERHKKLRRILYVERNRDKINERNRIRNQSERLTCLTHYGLKCTCCGESNIEFLQIDHVNNDGSRHRSTLTVSIFKWLIKNNFPDGFQVLCANCNWCKGRIGRCIHESH